MEYSGGNVTTDMYGPINTSPYSLWEFGHLSGDGVYGYDTHFGWSNRNNSTHTNTVTCSGKITATFTWKRSYADDVPPTHAVVCEESGAALWGGGASSITPTTMICDNGLGFPAVTASNMSGNRTSLNHTSQGTAYKIKEAGASFTVECSPYAKISGSANVGGNTIDYGGEIWVAYKASAAPLEIVLSGGIGPKDAKQYLIGQKVTANLTTGGLAASNFNWGVTGGNPFKNYTADAQNAVFTSLGAETGSGLEFSFAKPLFGSQTAQVSCAVTLAVPSNCLPVGGLTATLTRLCGVDKPLNTLSAWTGQTEGFPNSTNLQARRFYGANYSGYTSGILWSGAVTTPTAYGSGGGRNVSVSFRQFSFL